jgi:hypothetical protein
MDWFAQIPLERKGEARMGGGWVDIIIIIIIYMAPGAWHNFEV